MQSSQREVRTVVRSAYDMQKMRMMFGLRIVNDFKARLGQEPSKKEDDLSPEAQKILKAMRAANERITDGVAKLPNTEDVYGGMPLIETKAQRLLVQQYDTMLGHEDAMFKELEKVLREFPIYTEYLKPEVKGCGPRIAGLLIGELDINKPYPSCFHKYAGLDVGPDGRGRSRRKEHLVDVEYTDKDGKVATRKGITYNPQLKTQMWKLAKSFVMAGGHYREIYDAYKHRIETDPRHAEKTKGHRNNMALRYVAKMFLTDLHVRWREIAGLPVSKSYHEGKQGHVHRQAV